MIIFLRICNLLDEIPYKYSDAEKIILMSKYTWHISSRRYTSDLNTVTTDIQARPTAVPMLAFWYERNWYEVSVAMRGQHASHHHLLQTACQPGIS
jgi:hypothetical protein